MEPELPEIVINIDGVSIAQAVTSSLPIESGRDAPENTILQIIKSPSGVAVVREIMIKLLKEDAGVMHQIKRI